MQMKGKRSLKRFEPSVVITVKPTASDSPVAYAHKFLGRTLSLELRDGRTVEGKFLALDCFGNLHLNAVQQTAGEGIFELKEVTVAIARIRAMSALTPI
jgi:small nuclear ribonucleoprotein (snRNP)-like protein